MVITVIIVTINHLHLSVPAFTKDPSNCDSSLKFELLTINIKHGKIILIHSLNSEPVSGDLEIRPWTKPRFLPNFRPNTIQWKYYSVKRLLQNTEWGLPLWLTWDQPWPIHPESFCSSHNLFRQHTQWYSDVRWTFWFTFIQYHDPLCVEQLCQSMNCCCRCTLSICVAHPPIHLVYHV